MGKSSSTVGRFSAALEAECPLQVVGVINAYCALLAREEGFSAIYLSGAGVANASMGLPDLGLTSLDDVLIDVSRITGATDLPLLVDADTGFGDAAAIARTVRHMITAGAAAIHIEDQVDAKRCGHREGKRLVPTTQMVDRIKAAVDGRSDERFEIMARTDAHTIEGLDAAVDRAGEYVEAGADMIFAEALTSLEQYARFTAAVKVPVLANMTEFGKTPLYSREQLGEAGVQVVLYPLSAFRAMSQSALEVYRTLRQDGTQKAMVEHMQSREQLYEVLEYHAHERKQDQAIRKENESGC